MNKHRKAAAAAGIILVLGLGIILGMFFWNENRKEPESRQEQLESEHTPETVKDAVSEEEPESLEEEIQVQSEGAGDASITPEEEPPVTDVNTVTPVTMAFTGDIYLSHYVLERYDAEGIHGVISEYLLTEMKEADITMVNQEFPFSTRGTMEEDKQYTFRVDPDYISSFTDMGIDLVTIANNHTLDYGMEALEDTFETLDRAGILYVGGGTTKERAMQPAYIEAGGRKIGFLAASRVIPDPMWNIENRQPGIFCTYDGTALNAAIEEAKTRCDYVVVYVHWGVERENEPQEYQRTLARQYIDAGADLVIGSHPHVLQGIEFYNGKPVVYSLGNFIFNQEIPDTLLLKVTLEEDGNPRLTLVPVTAAGAFTREMEMVEAAGLLDYVEQISFSVEIDEDGTVRSR